MIKTCVFCGSTGALTREHVFGQWLSRLGLGHELFQHGVGRLNRSLRDLGVSKPFTRTVRDVCGACNNGWMGTLEATASRVLSSFVRGNPGSIEEDDCAAIASWAHKTALVNMLMTPDAGQARGDHFLAQELRNLYAIRNHKSPASQTRFWIGHYQGRFRIASAWMTPMTVNVDGLPAHDFPQAYVMTLVVGKVLLQGLRFTTPLLEFDVQAAHGFAQVWPSIGPVTWPVGASVDDAMFVKIAKGLNLKAIDSRFKLAPWKPAVDLPDSEAVRHLVRLPTPCGEHFVFYPGLLVKEALRGVRHAFIRSCECDKRYLVVTESDGAHFRDESTGALSPEDRVLQRYEALEGEELLISCTDGEFVFKRLPTRP